MLSLRPTPMVAPFAVARCTVRLVSFLTLIALYGAAYLGLYEVMGPNAGMVAVVPAIAAGWLRGASFGLLTGVSAIALNALINLWMLGHDDVSLLVRGLAALASGSIGYAVGRLRDTSVELERQLEDRKRLAKELTRAREELESKVEERTRALAHANAALTAEIAERQEAQEAQARLAEQRIALEQQLLRAQKMEAIGRLAGGVAHDFNNLLTAIIGFSELAASQTGEAQRTAIAQIGNAAARAAELTKALLAFARKEPVTSAIVDVNQLVTSTERLLERLIGEDIRLELSLADDVWPIQIDAARFEQVLVNLAVNARDAMPTGGILRISTENVRVDDYEFVRISVSDTGIGMDAATKARLFEPFFTTKEPGRGTGLGLATSYGIITQAGGQIHVRSAPGRGATFEIDMPRAEGRVVSATSSAKISGTVLRGRERLLIVEDEPLVRAIMEITLLDQGYEVFCADSPSRALDMLRTLRKVDAVISDVILPDQSGPELLERVRGLVPDVAVLYVSGYTAEAIHERNVYLGDGAFLAKPFAPAQLAEKLREVLERRRSQDRALNGRNDLVCALQ